MQHTSSCNLSMHRMSSELQSSTTIKTPGLNRRLAHNHQLKSLQLEATVWEDWLAKVQCMSTQMFLHLASGLMPFSKLGCYKLYAMYLWAAQAKTGLSSRAHSTTRNGAASTHPSSAWPMPFKAAPGSLKITSLIAVGAASSFGAWRISSPSLMKGRMHATCSGSHTEGAGLQMLKQVDNILMLPTDSMASDG